MTHISTSTLKELFLSKCPALAPFPQQPAAVSGRVVIVPRLRCDKLVSNSVPGFLDSFWSGRNKILQEDFCELEMKRKNKIIYNLCQWFWYKIQWLTPPTLLQFPGDLHGFAVSASGCAAGGGPGSWAGTVGACSMCWSPGLVSWAH